jgi:Flp pilus assembly pilin Flp
LQEKGRCGPAEFAPTEESRRGAEHCQAIRKDYHLPDDSKGGELVLKLFARREEGQTMAEYGVLLAVVTLTVVLSLIVLSDSIRTAFENLAGLLPG